LNKGSINVTGMFVLRMLPVSWEES